MNPKFHKRPKQLGSLAACFFMFVGIASGAEPSSPQAAAPLTPPALERSISDVIQQREYAWRMPREKAPAPKANLTWLDRALKSIGESLKSALQKSFAWLRKVIQWLTQNRSTTGGGGLALDWYGAVKLLLILLCIALVVLIVILIARMWRNPSAAESVAQPLPTPPDIGDEHTAADQLPEDGWLQLAQQLLAAGDLRLALRAFYLASLAHLAERNLITIARYKSNRDYERELARRAHSFPAVLSVFSENVSTFDRVWYGLHEVTRDLLDTFASNVTRIKTS